jgi:hypothetical protein
MSKQLFQYPDYESLYPELPINFEAIRANGVPHGVRYVYSDGEMHTTESNEIQSIQINLDGSVINIESN